MNAKQFWAGTASLAMIIVLCAVSVHRVMPTPTPVPAPAPAPVLPTIIDPQPAPHTAVVGIAAQKAKLKLTDGRSATFRFAISGTTLTAFASVGLDEECSYVLVPGAAPEPAPTPPPWPPPPKPEPPKPNPPTPEPPKPEPPAPVAKVSLTLITWSGQCEACKAAEAQTVRTCKALLDGQFSEIEYTDAKASALYPESRIVPRWVLDRGEGKPAEKKPGFLSADEVKAWIGGTP